MSGARGAAPSPCLRERPEWGMIRPRSLTAEQVSTDNCLLEQECRGYRHAHTQFQGPIGAGAVCCRQWVFRGALRPQRRRWACEARRRGVADLRKVRRNLLDLRMTGNFLRQYPQLAVKVAAALEKVKGKEG